MTTPIYDFVKKYAESGSARLHMPGHKGRGELGVEKYDITEISGADVLYSANGIIKESMDNASMLFGTGKTLYILDEPISGVDPAARDYVISTILNNYNPEATVLISTHLISDIEQILDEVLFLRDGHLLLKKSVEDIRAEEGKSVDELFREVFRW